MAIRRVSQKYAERVAISILLQFTGERKGTELLPGASEMSRAIHNLRRTNESAEIELKELEHKIVELGDKLMDIESKRASIHFQSFSLFNENTSLAIHVCGTDILKSAENPAETHAALDAILNRYVFKNTSI
ncbi:MAG: hypothetical protein M1442_02320 [Candidatus Thermoplasmatota archaeon]|nr:hypothetical protein [Candidatus Thermoplasmatota archaeon]